MKILISSISLFLGNYLYQFMQASPDYLVATERSYFMAVAIVFILIIQKRKPIVIEIKGAGINSDEINTMILKSLNSNELK